MRQELWNRFLETGSVEDYLEYACTVETAVNNDKCLKSGKEGEAIDRAGKAVGDGADSRTIRRL